MTSNRVVEVCPPDGTPLLVVVDHRIEVGRECDGVLVDDPLLSRRHLAIWDEGGQIVVEDLGSRNGSSIDGDALTGPTRLDPGRSVRAAGTTVRATGLVATTAPVHDGARTAHRATIARTADGALADGTRAGGPSVVSDATEAAVASNDVRSTMIETVARRVVDEAHTTSPPAKIARSGDTVTFLFSDIESSTERAQALGDRQWYDALHQHNQLLERLVARHDGTVVKAIGDGYMVTFTSARSAIKFAAHAQRELSRLPVKNDDQPLRVRMGMHTGEAVEADGDLFGLHVNVAARVANRATGGEVLVSSLTRAITQVAGDIPFGDEIEYELKGLSGTYGVSRLEWTVDAPAFDDAPPPGAAPEPPDDTDLRATTVVRRT